MTQDVGGIYSEKGKKHGLVREKAVNAVYRN